MAQTMILSDPCKIALAIAAIFGGWIFVGAVLHPLRLAMAWFLRTHPGNKSVVAVSEVYLRDSFAPLDFVLGATERSVAIALFLWHPAHLPTFIGAWVAAKLAANWQRIKSESAEVRQGSLVALIGSALSFGIAIFVAAFIKQHTAFLE